MDGHFLDWVGRAACGTADGSPNPLFDVPAARGQSPERKFMIRLQIANAKKICDGVPAVVRMVNGEAVVGVGSRPCPIKDKCLALAMDNERGSHLERAMIFGGLTPRERADLQLERERDTALAVEYIRPVFTVVPRRCKAPGSFKGAGRHLANGEEPCGPCLPFALSTAQELAVRRMVTDGYPNVEIFRRSTARAAHVYAVRVLLNTPDPGRHSGPKRVAEMEAAVRMRSYDPAKVERRMAGEFKLRLTRLERHELIRRAHAAGLTDPEIGRRYDVHAEQARRDRLALGLGYNDRAKKEAA